MLVEKFECLFKSFKLTTPNEMISQAVKRVLEPGCIVTFVILLDSIEQIDNFLDGDDVAPLQYITSQFQGTDSIE